jgi:hypothetical protein
MNSPIEISNRLDHLKRGHSSAKIWGYCHSDFAVYVAHGGTTNCGMPVAHFYMVEVSYKGTTLFRNYIFDVAQEDNYYPQVCEFIQKEKKAEYKHFLKFTTLMQQFAVQFCESPLLLFSNIATQSYNNGFNTGQRELQDNLKSLLGLDN